MKDFRTDYRLKRLFQFSEGVLDRGLLAKMEALATFAVACNVLQVIDSGLKAIELCKEISKYGTSIDNLDLEQRANLVAEYSKSLQDSRRNLAIAPTKSEAQLHDVADKCLTTASDLQNKLTKLRKGTRDGLTAGIKKLSKTWRHKKGIEDIERKMEKYQTILHTNILNNMSREQAALILDQQDRFDRLDDTLKTFLQRFVDGYKSLSDLISAEESQTRMAITQGSQRVKDHVDDRLGALRNDQWSESRRQRLLDSLKFPEMNFRRNDIENSHEGTFDFAFSDPDVQQPWDSLPNFLKGEGRFYWIQGKPGSGKSTLMKLINDDSRTTEALAQWRPEKEIFRMSFFFWLVGANPLQRSSRGLWCSLLYQLLSQDIRLIDSLHNGGYEFELKGSVDDWSVKELSTTFCRAMKLRSSPAFILLDGLDEFDQKEGASEIVKYLHELSSVPEVKLLASSRPEFEIKLELETTFPSLPQMRLQDLTKADITNYVGDFLLEATKKSQLGRISWEQVQKLIEEVVDKAEGVFIWVRYVLKSLIYGVKRCSTWEELQRHLKRCPAEIHDLYRETWKRLNPDEEMYREEAARYFYMATTDQAWASKTHRDCHQFSVFDLMLASNHKLHRQILSTEKNVPLSELVELCSNTEERLAARCAGLLQISDLSFHEVYWTEVDSEVDSEEEPEEEPEEPKDERKNNLSNRRKLRNYIRRRHVSIIHRSVHDFLTGTVEGRRILSFFNPTREQWSLTNTRLDMAILRTLGWEDGYYCRSISDDLRSVPFLELARHYHYRSSDDTVRERALTVISSYARALHRDEDEAAAEWNFRLPNQKEYRNFLRMDTPDCVDVVGLAVAQGLNQFLRFFVQQVGQGRKLCTEYVDYLLHCACEGINSRSLEYLTSEIIAWLLNQRANPNKRQYHLCSVKGVLEAKREFVQVSTTPFLSYLQHHTAYFNHFFYEAGDFNLGSNLHQLLSAGANSDENAIMVLTEWQLLTLAKWLGSYHTHDGAAILLEAKVGKLLGAFPYGGPICPSGRSHGTSDDGLEIRFLFRRENTRGMGRFWQPGNEEAALILSAHDRYVKVMSGFVNRLANDVSSSSESIWNKHVERTFNEVIPRCREVPRADVYTWLFENGWVAPDGYVSPVDVDHPFEDD